MLKRFLAVAATAGTLLAGAVVVAPTASADVYASCRSWNTNPSGQWVGEPGGAELDACSAVSDTDFSSVIATVGYSTTGSSIFPCAQLINVATGQWQYNYGCAGWIPQNTGRQYHTFAGSPDVPRGTYVVQVGYWMDNGSGSLQYYGNVQSPRITVG